MAGNTNKEIYQEIKRMEERLAELKGMANQGENEHRDQQETLHEIHDMEVREEATREAGSNPYLIPGSILLAGIIIAAGIVYVQGGFTASLTNNDNAPTPTPTPTQQAASPGVENMKPLSAEDHVRGSLDAPVVLVEYSDLECPFCQRFHNTLQQVYNEYGSDQVAWVYRHFPLVNLHSKAPKEAEATECAAELGGNEAFWAYTDTIFEITPANNGLDLSLLPQIAEDIGLDREAFTECLNSGKYSQKIQESYEDAVSAGGRGTPYTVVVTPNGSQGVSGALQYEQMKQIIDSVLTSR